MTLAPLRVPTSTFRPRPYQAAAREGARRVWAEKPGAMLVLATGTGKTYTALHIAVEDFLRHGARVAFLAHQEELLLQAHASLCKGWPEYRARSGIVQAARDTPGVQVVFASIPTLDTSSDRLDAILRHGPPELVIVDECHHSVSPSHRRVIEAFGARSLLGLTATPERDGDGDLSELWEVAHSYPILDAIRDGWLVQPYAAVCPLPGFDPSQISGRRDYDDAEQGAALLKNHVVEHTVKVMRQVHRAVRLPRQDDVREMRARGRSTLVYTATVEQARLTAEALAADGWKARWVCGDTPTGERKRLNRAFTRGQIEVLCNAALYCEGTDMPRANCVVLARATRSHPLFVQIVGRGLRIFDDRWDPTWGLMNAHDPRYRGDTDCLVIDLAGATQDHSLVSAPALIGGSRCPSSPSGEHDYQPAKKGGAACSHCDSTLPCYAALEASEGASGAHNYVEGHCSHCNKPQCAESPTAMHHWVAQPGGVRQCSFCGRQVPDALAGLQADRRRSDVVTAKWLPLPQLRGLVEVCDLEEHGLVYLLGDGDGWQVVWLPKRGRKGRAMTASPVDRWEAEAIASDLLRRARRAWDPWTRQELPGAKRSTDAYVDLRIRAASRAAKCGVASWR